MDIGLVAALGALAIGYLLGSIPFGLVLTRAAGMGDLREIGSGNIGATNVLRTGKRGLAVATLLLDALKGTAAVLIAPRLFPGAEAGMLAGLAAFVGHCFPFWLGFRGGKGVATYIGVLAAIAWPVALAFAAIWLVTAVLSRYSSLSALVATALIPVIFLFSGQIGQAVMFAAMGAISWVKHRQNISRLLAGNESRIGMKG
jgi:acyl phosphate:glycerol-3-phosphate acyltransferase